LEDIFMNAIEMIKAERERQISAEGWTPEHDDTHSHREMAAAAAAYLEHYITRSWSIDPTNPLNQGIDIERYQNAPPPEIWPEGWEGAWKPKYMTRDLVIAGALIVAEIERLERVHSSNIGIEGTDLTGKDAK
jgi:hypothetical protein